MNSGNAVEFVCAYGMPTEMCERVEQMKRHGTPGVALRRFAVSSEPFRLTLHRDVATPGEIIALRKIYAQFCGKLVTLKLPFGNNEATWTYVGVLKVRPVRTRSLAKGTGGLYVNPHAIIADEFEMQITTVPS